MENGKPINSTIGKYLRILTQNIFMRYGGIVRQMCDFFDYIALGSKEAETFRNARNFRSFVNTLIAERREEMKEPDFKSQGDFLTLMLLDPFFDTDEMIIDECNSFMIAANITTSITLTNALFYLIRH